MLGGILPLTPPAYCSLMKPFGARYQGTAAASFCEKAGAIQFVLRDVVAIVAKKSEFSRA